MKTKLPLPGETWRYKRYSESVLITRLALADGRPWHRVYNTSIPIADDPYVSWDASDYVVKHLKHET